MNDNNLDGRSNHSPDAIPREVSLRSRLENERANIHNDWKLLHGMERCDYSSRICTQDLEKGLLKGTMAFTILTAIPGRGGSIFREIWANLIDNQIQVDHKGIST